MHPGWISNHWTPGSDHFTGSHTTTKNCIPRALQAGWPCLSIRNTRTAVQHTTHSSFLQSPITSIETLRTRWAGQLLRVSSKKLEGRSSSSWKWIPPWSWLWGESSDGGANRGKQRWERDLWEHMLRRRLHMRLTHLCKLHSFMGILISLRLSFPS